MQGQPEDAAAPAETVANAPGTELSSVSDKSPALGAAMADRPAEPPENAAATALSSVSDKSPTLGEAMAEAPLPPPGPELPAPPDPAVFAQALRIAEALIFAAERPVTLGRLAQALPPGVEPRAVVEALVAQCADRPVHLAEVAGGYAFRTAPDLAPAITRVVEVPRRLPRVAMETLAIIAYHQPVTRGEIEEIRGTSLAQTTLEALLELGLVVTRGRREVPGRPSLWVTTPRFLEQFGLKALGDLPRREELVTEPGPIFRAVPAPVAEAEAGPESETQAEAEPAPAG
jgi:segregation and condensation protein B